MERRLTSSLAVRLRMPSPSEGHITWSPRPELRTPPSDTVEAPGELMEPRTPLLELESITSELCYESRTPELTPTSDKSEAVVGYRVLIDVVVSVNSEDRHSAVVIDATMDGTSVIVQMLSGPKEGQTVTLPGSDITPLQPSFDIGCSGRATVKVLDGEYQGKIGHLTSVTADGESFECAVKFRDDVCVLLPMYLIATCEVEGTSLHESIASDNFIDYTELRTPSPHVEPMTPEEEHAPRTPELLETKHEVKLSPHCKDPSGYKVLLDMVVSVSSENKNSGVVIDAAEDGRYVTVKMLNGASKGETLKLVGSDITPVQPRADIIEDDMEMVKVLDGEYKGKIGHLIRVIGNQDSNNLEGVVHFQDGVIEMLSLSLVARYNIDGSV